MTLPSNMNELIDLLKENILFLGAFILLMILVDYFIILKRRNRTTIETISDEEYEAAEQRLAIKRKEETKKWERQLFFELRTRSVKRRQNYQSKIRRTYHGRQYRRSV